jgi:uncharacterized membrane protein
MIYFVAGLLFDRATGLLSALLLSLSLFHIEFAQEARMYSLLAFLSLCSLYFFLKLFDQTKERRRGWRLVGYVLTTSLLMHTHVYGFFIIIAENLFVASLLFKNKELLRRMLARWLLLQASLVLLFLPWLSVMLRQFERVQQGFWIPQPTLDFLRQTWLLYSGSTLLALLFIPLVALGLLARSDARSDGHSTEERAQPTAAGRRLPLGAGEKMLLMLLWFLAPILIPFALSQKLASIYLPKYTIAASTAFLVLAARGIMSLRFDRARVVLVAVVLGLSLAQMRGYWSAPHKDYWRESASYFEHTAQAGDLVLFHQGNGQVPFEYYSKRDDIKQAALPDDPSQLTTANVGSVLQPLVAGHNRVWLVASHQNEGTESVKKQLGEWYKVTEHRIDPGVELYLFEKGTTPQ